MHTEFCSGNPLGDIHLEDRGDGKTRLRWIEGILDERRGGGGGAEKTPGRGRGGGGV